LNFLRRIPLSRLLLLCALIVAIGVSVTALAFALGSGPTPPPKPLPQAVHDALAGGQAHQVEGLSANITLTDHLLEGASLAGGAGAGGGIASNPLLTGASGRLWIAKDGRTRLELQSEKGDTEIVYDGHTVTIYDAAENSVYRYTPKQEASGEGGTSGDTGSAHGVPSVQKIEEAVAHIRKHAQLSEATPTDVAGQPAYTVRLSPGEGGSLLGGAELSFDADNGLPLRAAVYSTTSSAPVIELAASEVSFGAVPDSIFQLSPPPGVKVEQIEPPADHATGSPSSGEQPKVTIHGHGITGIAVVESKSEGKEGSSSLEGLPKVDINGTSASELKTELGTILSFERGGVRYVLAGALPAASIEALARGL